MSQRSIRLMHPAIDLMTHWLIHRAARRVPDALGFRLEEEWLADLESRSSTRSKLRLAAGCWWAAIVIAREFPRVAVPATALVAIARGPLSFPDRHSGYLSLRSGTVFLIVGLYAALFCGLMFSMSPTPGSATTSSLEFRTPDPAQP